MLIGRKSGKGFFIYAGKGKREVSNHFNYFNNKLYYFS